MSQVATYLNFTSSTEEAFQFYKSVFLAKRLAYVFGFFVHIAIKAKYAVFTATTKPS